MVDAGCVPVRLDGGQRDRLNSIVDIIRLAGFDHVAADGDCPCAGSRVQGLHFHDGNSPPRRVDGREIGCDPDGNWDFVSENRFACCDGFVDHG
nr:hypothetical protein [Stieleria maiorica]